MTPNNFTVKQTFRKSLNKTERLKKKCNISLGIVRGKERFCTLPKGHKGCHSWWKYPNKEILEMTLPYDNLTYEERVASIGW